MSEIDHISLDFHKFKNFYLKIPFFAIVPNVLAAYLYAIALPIGFSIKVLLI